MILPPPQPPKTQKNRHLLTLERCHTSPSIPEEARLLVGNPTKSISREERIFPQAPLPFHPPRFPPSRTFPPFPPPRSWTPVSAPGLFPCPIEGSIPPHCLSPQWFLVPVFPKVLPYFLSPMPLIERKNKRHNP